MDKNTRNEIQDLAKDFVAASVNNQDAATKALQAAVIYKEVTENTLQRLQDTISQPIKAVIPPEELRKIGDIQLEAPDLTPQVEEFSDALASKIGPAVKASLENNYRPRVDVKHTHFMANELAKYAEEISKKMIRTLAGIILCLAFLLAWGYIRYVNSWVSWGQRYEKVAPEVENPIDTTKTQFEKGRKERNAMKLTITARENITKFKKKN